MTKYRAEFLSSNLNTIYWLNSVTQAPKFFSRDFRATRTTINHPVWQRDISAHLIHHIDVLVRCRQRRDLLARKLQIRLGQNVLKVISLWIQTSCILRSFDSLRHSYSVLMEHAQENQITGPKDIHDSQCSLYYGSWWNNIRWAG